MDFGSLLQTAKQNERKKTEVRYYSTKFSAPRKEEKKARNLSANIQKFLAKKEAEEKQVTKAANQRRDELLALRSKDKKATRRVNVMLKRTKSANQSVIEDAVDKDNTAVTLAGPSQPDEDDYGYVSQEAAAYYNKMMEKYNKMPDDPKFTLAKKKASSNLNSTKDRVRAALEKEKEEAMLPHRRKRKHKEQTENDVEEYEEKRDVREEKNEIPKSKPKSAGPPPLNFSELLKLAAQKQHEPIVIEVKPKEEEGPLMTKKQKKEQERVQQWKDGRNKQNNKVPQGKSEQIENRIPKLSSVQQSSNKLKEAADVQIPKSNNIYKNNDKISKGNVPDSYNKLSKVKQTSSQNMKPQERDSNILKSALKYQKPEGSANKSDIIKQRPLNNLPKKSMETKQMPNKISSNFKDQERKMAPPKNASNSSTIHSTSRPVSSINSLKKDPKIENKSRDLDKRKPISGRERELPPKRLPPNDLKPKQFPPNGFKPKQFPPNDLKPKQFPPNDLKPKQFPPNDLKPKQFPPNDLRPKQFPPKDLKMKQFPPPDVRRRECPQKDIKRKPPLGSKRRILDDDSEYDSEMDDFIDDGPEEMEDYSKYIKDIFGYDKSRYRGMDEDDIDNMESSFAQQMREDIRSTKLGIMEDLEDIQREKDEKIRKAKLKKRKL